MGRKVGIIFVGLLILVASGFSFAAGEADFPNRPIELVNPYPAGGVDYVVSVFRERAGKFLGQPMVVTYKPGAAGATACQFVANAKPDGYTVLVIGTLISGMYPLTKKGGAGYTQDSFAPIVQLAEGTTLLLVRDDSPYKTLQDFVQAAKTQKMKYASFGYGSTGHITMGVLEKRAGFTSIHIPYTGGGAIFTAVLGKHVDIGIAGSTGGMVRPGMLRVLAVSSKERSKVFPEIPTLIELGYGVYAPAKYFICGPTGIPKERINKIWGAFKKAVDQEGKEIEALLRQGETAMSILSPEELADDIQADMTDLRKFFGEIGLLVN